MVRYLQSYVSVLPVDQRVTGSSRPSVEKIRQRWENTAAKARQIPELTKLSTPDFAIKLAKEPSFANYKEIHKLLKTRGREIMEPFVGRNGLLLLFDGLEALCAIKLRMSEMPAVLECVRCIRQVMNSEAGLSYLVRAKQDEAAEHFADLLQVTNTAVKKQALELLSAICAYSEEGLFLVMKCLKHLKRTRNVPVVFTIIVEELRQAAGKQLPEYIATIICFVNTLLLSTKEFGIANLPETLDALHEALFMDALVHVAELTDEVVKFAIASILATLEECNDLSVLTTACKVAVVQTLSCLRDGSCQETFLQCLQRIRSQADDVTERPKLIIDLQTAFGGKQRFGSGGETTSSSDLSRSPSPPAFLNASISPPGNATASAGSPPAVPPSAPPPPPPPFKVANGIQLASGNSSAPAPPPPPPGRLGHSGGSTAVPPPPPAVSRPMVKLKPVRWSKITASAERVNQSVWGQPTRPELRRLDSTVLRTAFKDDQAAGRRGSDVPSTPRSITPQNQLIDSKRSLKINVWLKQFRDIHETAHAGFIENLDTKCYDSDDLNGLSFVLPTPEERKLFTDPEQNFDQEVLGSAERFLMSCSRIPDCSLLVEVMKAKTDFNTLAVAFRDDFLDTKNCCQTIMKSESFRSFLHIALRAGNVLNESRHDLGAASAIKLSGLCKLSETVASGHKVSLLQFIVQDIKSQGNLEILTFLTEFECLQKAKRLDFENLCSHFVRLSNSLKTLQSRMQLSSAKAKSEEFFERVLAQLDELEALMKQTSESVALLIDYFLEETSKDAFESIVRNILAFIAQVKKAREELENTSTTGGEEQKTATKAKTSLHKGFHTLPRSFRSTEDAKVAMKVALESTDDLQDGLLKELLIKVKTGSRSERVAAIRGRTL